MFREASVHTLGSSLILKVNSGRYSKSKTVYDLNQLSFGIVITSSYNKLFRQDFTNQFGSEVLGKKQFILRFSR
jgi:hypothetical protein